MCTTASLDNYSCIYNFSCVSLIDNGSRNKIICISSDYCIWRKCIYNLVVNIYSEAAVAHISEYHCIESIPLYFTLCFTTSLNLSLEQPLLLVS